MSGILRWDEVDNEIKLEAININTEIAIKNKRIRKTRTSEAWSPKNIITGWMYSKQGKRRHCQPIDTVSIEESIWKK